MVTKSEKLQLDLSDTMLKDEDREPVYDFRFVRKSGGRYTGASLWSKMRTLKVSEGELKKEWHTQPISTTIHVITLIVLVAGFGGLIQNLSYRSTLMERRLELQESVQRDDNKLYINHESKLQVLESRLNGIEGKLGSIDGKLDDLVEKSR